MRSILAKGRRAPAARRLGQLAAAALLAPLLLCGLSFLSGACRAEPMRFRLLPGAAGAGTAIAAEGEIADSTPAEFQNFLRAHAAERRGRVAVFLDSPGGKIVAGIELGRMLRAIGATAYVARAAAGEGGAARPSAGDCFSACVYALMGGRTRIAPRASRIGIHRMFAYHGGVRRLDNGEMAAMLRRYSSSMGVSPDIIAATEQGTPDGIRILTPAEIARWRLASPGS